MDDTIGSMADQEKLSRLKAYLDPGKLATLSPDKRTHLEELLRTLERRRAQRRFYEMFPDDGDYPRHRYPKHVDFMNQTANFKEMAFVAANRVGKSLTGAFMMTAFCTGHYPHWWRGRRFPDPVKAWAAGDTAKTARDIIQVELLGPHDARGTGMIPGELITRTPPKSGVPDAVDAIVIKHQDPQGHEDGTSMLQIKSYDQGRKAFQGTAQDVIWLDEECPMDVYSECLMRTMTTNGLIFLTFTPLEGLTQLVLDFMPGGKPPGD